MAKRSTSDAFEDAQPSSSKKARRNQAESDDEEEEGEESQDETMEDGPEVPGEEEQAFKASRSGQEQIIGSVAEAGVINKVVLINFMCHQFLEIKLGPQINFLTGHNGSGKSAVLTALTIALGAKASSTGRGAGTKGFIRTGQDQCQITVHIKNKGPEAYMPELYGSEIIVERNLSREGQGNYKIKSSLQKPPKTVSSKREELDRILDHLNIQIDNPINVLSQDAARAFLTKSDNKAKYEFFMRGTQLAQLNQEYYEVQLNLEIIRQSLHQKRSILPEMKEAAAEALAKVAKAKLSNNLHGKAVELEAELQWTVIIEKEQEVARLDKETELARRKLQKLEAKIEELSGLLVTVRDTISKTEEEKAQHSGSVRPTKERLGELQLELQEYTKRIRSLRPERADMEQNIRQAELSARDYRSTIAEETAKLEADTSEEKRQQAAFIESIENKITKIELQIPISEQAVADENNQREAYRAQLQELQDQQARTSNQLGRAKMSHQQAEAARGGGPLAPYGDSLEPLLSKINSTRWTGMTPIGPLGLHVKLKDMQWSKMVEANLAGMMTGFAITSGADLNPLKQLFADCQRQYGSRFRSGVPSITIFKPDPTKDISSGDLGRKGFQTMLSLLNFQDGNVRDIFVDRAAVERTPVTWNRSDARDISTQAGTAVLTAEPLFRVSGNTNSFVQEYRGVSLFPVDREAEIREAERAVQEMKRSFDQISEQRRGVENEMRQHNALIQKKEDDVSRLRAALGQNKHKLQDAIDASREEEPANIDALRSALAEEEEIIANTSRQLAENLEREKQLKEEMQPLIDERAELLRMREEGTGVMNGFDERLIELAKNHTKIASDTKHYEARLEPERAKLQKLQEDLAISSEECADWEARVREGQDGNRINTERPRATVEKELNVTKKNIEKHNREIGVSLEDAEAQLRNASDAYNKAKGEITDMQNLANSLENSLRARTESWLKFRGYCSMRAKVNFQHNLSKRGFSGKLHFAHDTGEISLKVNTNASEQNENGGTQGFKKANQLSGGEKSFSTVALLLAFWDTVGCPIRCLDEFDVFMDATVRKQTLNMMMKTAQSTDATQFILITPQDMSGVFTSNAIKIVRMPDPQRGTQSNLNGFVDN